MTRFMNTTRILLIAGLTAAALACGEDTPPPSPAASGPAAAAPVAQPQPPVPAQPAPTMQSNFGTVTLEAGFVPDPHVVSGTSGGNIDASTLSAGCSGWVSSTPDHILDARGAFSTMRILGHSSGDVTLVVQKPDGSYLCNDDAEGTDPVVEGSFAAGSYRIWVGSYEQGRNAQYRLGFSELSSTRAASL